MILGYIIVDWIHTFYIMCQLMDRLIVFTEYRIWLEYFFYSHHPLRNSWLVLYGNLCLTTCKRLHLVPVVSMSSRRSIVA